MTKVGVRYFIVISIFLMLLTGFSLTAWKMFEFRDRLHMFTDNKRWEEMLSKHNMYAEDRIVFFGDSQVELWWSSPSFGSLPIVNKGVSGDKAITAIDRFDRDALSLNPQTLVLLIGTNDLAEGYAVDDTVKIIDQMAGKAFDQGINLILCSVLPVRGELLEIYSVSDIRRLNLKIQEVSKRYKADYVDLYSGLVDAEGLFREELTYDGLHPNRSGYFEMSKRLMPYLMKSVVMNMQEPS
ncbi:MAG: hypothetical protein K6L81_17395 [Agarilytica sp.]